MQHRSAATPPISIQLACNNTSQNRSTIKNNTQQSIEPPSYLQPHQTPSQWHQGFFSLSRAQRLQQPAPSSSAQQVRITPSLLNTIQLTRSSPRTSPHPHLRRQSVLLVCQPKQFQCRKPTSLVLGITRRQCLRGDKGHQRPRHRQRRQPRLSPGGGRLGCYRGDDQQPG